MMIRIRIVGLVSWIFLYCVSLQTWANPKSEYFTIQPKNEAIARIYTGLLDRDIQHALQSFNPDSGLVQVQISGDDSSKEYSHIKQYQSLQETANLAGAMGYAYSIPTSNYYQSNELLNNLRIIFNTITKLHNEPGGITNSARNVTNTAYILEALMTSYALTHKNFSSSEQKNIESMLIRSLDTFSGQEPVFANHNCIVWCSVMAMGSRFSSDPKYLDMAKSTIKRIIPSLIQNDGQITEDSGVDPEKSVPSLLYLFQYKLLSEENQFDEIFIRSLKWISQLYSFHGVPLSGMDFDKKSSLACMMGILTYYSEEDSLYEQLSTRYLESLISLPVGITLQHGSGNFLRGIAYHDKPDSLPELPYQPYSQFYSTNQTEYFTVGRNYQTLVTIKSTEANKGMQVWSYKGQSPVISPARNAKSHVLGFGIDSAKLNRSGQYPYQHTELSDGLETFIYQQNDLISGYVFAEDITVVVYRDGYENGWVDWVMGAPITLIQDNRILFEETEARVFLPPVEPLLLEEEGRQVIRFPYKSGTIWFTFAGPESIAVVQPVIDGVVLMQLNDEGETINLVLNVDTQPFEKEMNFPGTEIPVPKLDVFGSALIDRSK